MSKKMKKNEDFIKKRKNNLRGRRGIGSLNKENVVKEHLYIVMIISIKFFS